MLADSALVLCSCPTLVHSQLALFEPMLAGPHQLRSAVVKAFAAVLLHMRTMRNNAAAAPTVKLSGDQGDARDDEDNDDDDDDGQRPQRQRDTGANLLRIIHERALRDASAFTRKQALMVRPWQLLQSFAHQMIARLAKSHMAMQHCPTSCCICAHD